MNKKQKRIITSLLITIPLISIGTICALTFVNKSNISNNTSNDNLNSSNNLKYEILDYSSVDSGIFNGTTDNYGFLYNNVLYDTYQEILDLFISENNPISSELYLGDSFDAIYDTTDHFLDISKLRKYIPSKVLPAYKDVFGNYTPDYDVAKKTFVSEKKIKYKWDDLNGTLFDTYQEAKDSIDAQTEATPVMYYEFPVSPNFDKDEAKRFNPLSSVDLYYLKKDIYNSFRKILSANKVDVSKLKNNKNFSLSIYDIQKNKYSKNN